MKNYIGIIIFVILFISAISIVAILIARGYNFTENEVRENGIFEINSVPEGATILINQEEKGKTPKKIELSGGTYEVRLQIEKYTEWSKEIEIEPSIVTTVNATLFPEEKKVDQVTFSSLDKVFFSDDGDIALYVVTKKPNTGIWINKLEKTIFEISSEKPEKIYSLDIIPESAIDSGDYTILISKDKRKALLQASVGNIKHVYILDLIDTNTPAVYLNQEIGLHPTSVRFGFNSDSLLIIDDAVISHYTVPSKELHLLARKKESFAPSISSFGDEYMLLDYDFVKEQPYLQKITAGLQKQEFQLSGNVDESTVTDISATGTTNDYLTLNTKSAAYVYNSISGETPIQKIADKPISVLTWSPNGKTFLYTLGNRLLSCDITRRPDNTIKIKTTEIFKEYSGNIYTVKWAPNSEQIIVHNKKQETIFALDKDGTNQVQLYEGRINDSEAFTLSKGSTFLVVLLDDSKTSANLYSIKLRL